VLAAGFLLPLVLAASLSAFRTSLPSSDTVLVLVLVVVAAAATGRRSAGLVAAVSAGLWFDFFLTRPYERFSISEGSDIVTTVVLVVVGLAVSELAVRGLGHRRRADTEAGHLDRIRGVSAMVAGGEPAQFVVLRVASELTSLLGLRDCRFVEGERAVRRAHVKRTGEVVIAGVRWDTADLGLPGHEVDLPVMHRGERMGSFVLTPARSLPVGRETLLVAVVLADQVGAALARNGMANA
jgi:K+-sensing histidine kinase KdpD